MRAVPLPLARTALASVNHLLGQQAWARDKLRAHAGRTVRIVVEAPFEAVSSSARIGDDGLLDLAEDSAPAATLRFRPSVDALFALLRGGPRGLAGHLSVDGDVMVAAAVGEVAQHLRWEFEEDLSRIVGDRIAHRVGDVTRRGIGRADELRGRIESGVRQYLVDEAPTLVSGSDMRSLADSVRALHRRMDRLEARAAEQPPR